MEINNFEKRLLRDGEEHDRLLEKLEGQKFKIEDIKLDLAEKRYP